MDIYRNHVRVTYGEVDGALRLTHRGAMSIMQEAAIVHSSQSGYAMEDVDRTHVIWMVVRWRVRLTGRAVWNDALTVETWPRSMGRLTSVRNFRLLDAQNNPVAVGESEWLLVSTDTGRVARITRIGVASGQHRYRPGGPDHAGNCRGLCAGGTGRL